MYRILLIVVMVLLVSYFVDIAETQEVAEGSATIRGEVVDNTLEENPLEGVSVTITNQADGEEQTTLTDKHGMYAFEGLIPGRYDTKSSKDGYWERIGKTVVVAQGGEAFVRIRLPKVKNIASFLLKELFTWQLFLGIAIGAVAVLILLSLRSKI